jgi:hypothetical protein
MHLNDRGIPSPLPAIKRKAGEEGAIVRPGSSMPVVIPTTGVHNRKREASLEPQETTSELVDMHVPDEEDNTDFNEESQFSASEEETEETSENTHSTSISRVDKSDHSGDSDTIHHTVKSHRVLQGKAQCPETAIKVEIPCSCQLAIPKVRAHQEKALCPKVYQGK